MSDPLRLALLGKPQFERAGQPLPGLTSVKGQALLAYLAVTRQPHSRTALAGLLWSEMPEEAARTNLRVTLSLLHKAVGDAINATRRSVEFNQSSDTWLDVAMLENAYSSRNNLAAAAGLYRGDFLDDFFVPEAGLFEEWVLVERERLRQLALSVLETAADIALEQHQFAAGIPMARRLLSLEPWHEGGHRQLMKLLAAEGQTSAALAQYETCRRLLAEELKVEPAPETKGLAEAIRSGDWKIPEPVPAETIVPVSPVEPRLLPNNLPAATTSFVGRQAEQAQIAELLARPDCRLLTITGPGGIGKTRLALETARRYVQKDPTLPEPDVTDGVYFVPLASLAMDSGADGLNNPALVLNAVVTAVAEALEVSFRGEAELRLQLFKALQQKVLLLVLDNFEHLLTGLREKPGLILLADILQQAPRVKLLVTSRERLNLQEEWLLEVVGLTYPLEDWTGGDILTASTPPTPRLPSEQTHQAAHNFSAIALFIQRAQQNLSGFTLSEADLPLVVRICQLLEGMPLGLELAASWVQTFSCAEIVSEIERNLDFLATRLRNLPARHRSLRAVFDHSWRMLSPQEREVFCKLSIFRGGFTRQAAARVANASLEALAVLVDKSLIRRTATGRYGMHEMLRQYGAEKLWLVETDVEVGEAHQIGPNSRAETVWDRYSRYYLGLVSQYETALYGSRPQQAVAKLRSELANIRRAWCWATINAGLADIERCLEALADFYELIGLFQEAEDLFGTAIALLEQEANQPDLACNLLIKRARFARLQGNYKGARLTVENALQQAERNHNPLRRAEARQLLGLILIYLGELDQAIESLKLAVTDFQALAQPRQLAYTLSSLGDAYSRKHLAPEALDCLEQALQLNQQLDNKRAQAFISGMIGNVYDYTEKYDIALAYQQNVLALYQELDYAWGVGATLINIGLLYYYLERYQEALTTSNEALRILRRLGALLSECATLENLGAIHMAQGRYPQAQACLEQALSLSLDIGTKLGQSYVTYRLGQLYAAKGDYHQSLAFLHQAVVLSEAVGDPKHTAACRGELGIVYHRLKDFDQALLHYDQAITALQSLEVRFDTAHFMVQQATLLFEQNQLDQAQMLAAAGVRLAQEVVRPQTIFDGQLLQAKIAFASGQPALAQQHLQALLSIADNESRQAALHYELWKMNQNQEDARLALLYYRQLAAQTMNVLYQERLNELQSYAI